MTTMVIDGDGHFLEPVSLWEEYLDRPYRDQVSIGRDDNGHATRVVVGDTVIVDFPAKRRPWGPGDAYRPGGLKHGPQFRPYEEAAAGGFDAHERLEVHDENGIDAAVLFPSFGLNLGFAADIDASVVLCRALNRWAHDYAAVAPGELYVVATLPWQAPELAADELRRCVERGAVAGLVAPYPARDGRRISDPSFDVLWGTAVDLDVPICCHTGMIPGQLGFERVREWFSLHAAVHPLEGMMAFAAMYEGGVFERFLGLRVGYMESGCGWVPFWLERLDEQVEHVAWNRPGGWRLPGETFRTQCVVGSEGDEDLLPLVQDTFGEDRVLWASDFPHFDTEPPFTGEMLSRADLTESGRASVMAHAAAAFYKLDDDAIRRAVAVRRSSGSLRASGRG